MRSIVYIAEYVLRRRLFAGNPVSLGRVCPPALRASSSMLTVFLRPIVLRRIVSWLSPTAPPFWHPYGQYHQPSSDPLVYSQSSTRLFDWPMIDSATLRCRGHRVGRSPAWLLPNSWPS